MKTATLSKAAAVWVSLLLLMLAGCSSDDSKSDLRPQVSPTPAPVVWLRPQSAIGQDGFPQVRVTGLMRLHQQTVNDVAFSRSGTRLASVGADSTAVIWNLANGQSLFVNDQAGGRNVFFGPDDATLITINRDGVAQVWDIDMSPPRELRLRTTFEGYDQVAHLVVQSPDRSLLAFGAATGGIRLWQVPDGTLVADIPAYYDNQAIQDLAFSPDGAWLVSLAVNRTIRVWTVPSGDMVYDLTLPEGIPLRAAFSPDSKQLAVAHLTGVQLWDLESGTATVAIEMADHAATNALAFSPDGQLLVGCGAQPVIPVWDTTSGELLGGLPIPGQTCASVAFSPDSTLLLTLPASGDDVYLWDILHITDDVPIEEKALRRRTRENMGLFPGARFYDMAWSDDGRFIILLDQLGPLYVLSAAE